jgi:hypothetical protein
MNIILFAKVRKEYPNATANAVLLYKDVTYKTAAKIVKSLDTLLMWLLFF